MKDLKKKIIIIFFTVLGWYGHSYEDSHPPRHMVSTILLLHNSHRIHIKGVQMKTAIFL